MRGIRLFLLFSVFCFLSGCSGLKEATRGFFGVSTKVLEDKRAGAIKKDFNVDLATMHKKIIDILQYEDAYVYRDDLAHNLIALYVLHNGRDKAFGIKFQLIQIVLGDFNCFYFRIATHRIFTFFCFKNSLTSGIGISP